MIQQLRRQLDSALADHRAAVASVAAGKVEAKKASRQVQAAQEAQALLQEVAQQVQRTVHTRIAVVVSRCLDAVFGEGFYEFKLDWEQKRGRTEAVIRLVRDGNELDPLDGAGGGVCDVVSWALQLAALLLARPKLRRFLACDEPFRHVDAGRRPAVREMLMTLAEEMGFQLLVITHSKEIVTGNVIEIGT